MSDEGASPEYTYNDCEPVEETEDGEFSYNDQNCQRKSPDLINLAQIKRNEITKKLIRAVKKHPCIYDRNLTVQKRNLQVRTKAWKDIAKKLKSTVEECKMQWNRIRITFCRILRVMLNNQKLGLPDHSKGKPQWTFYRDMKFLAPHFRTRMTQNGHLDYYCSHARNQLDTNTTAGSSWETIEINDDDTTPDCNNIDDGSAFNSINETCEESSLKIVKVESIKSVECGKNNFQSITEYENSNYERNEMENKGCQESNVGNIKIEEDKILISVKIEDIKYKHSTNNLESREIDGSDGSSSGIIKVEKFDIKCEFPQSGNQIEQSVKNYLTPVKIEQNDTNTSPTLEIKCSQHSSDLENNLTTNYDITTKDNCATMNLEDITHKKEEIADLETKDLDKNYVDIKIENVTQTTCRIDEDIIRDNENGTEKSESMKELDAIIIEDDDDSTPFDDNNVSTNEGDEEDKFNLKLIEVVKRYPVIFASDGRSFHTREGRRLVWDIIAKEMNRNVNDCKSRWMHLERRYVHALKNPIRTPEDRRDPCKEDQYRKQKWFTINMKFMEPYVLARRKYVPVKPVKLILGGKSKMKRPCPLPVERDSAESSDMTDTSKDQEEDDWSEHEAEDYVLKTYITNVLKDSDNRKRIRNSEEIDDLACYTNFFC